MPCIPKDRKVIAKVEPLSLYEQILLQPLHHYKLPAADFTPHQRQEAIKQLRQHHYEWLPKKKAKLLPLPLIDCISDPFPPLIDRLGPPVGLQDYKPVPSNLHFRKTKVLSHIKEYKNLFAPTVDRLTPLIKKALVDDHILEDVKGRINA
ncbi:hypothetical protein NUW54_g6872 [Trametes sanguinea]|uniref:Uncharacterized protein n=1 Tax=Trametes sanguinea TaxID=158606 RepID=A0ACC1PUD8_9APHY|nr:hypothetical protein NUW54_g6872 [Trametes sanguinea]